MENLGIRVPADRTWWMIITSNIDFIVLCSALSDVTNFIWDLSINLEIRRPYAKALAKIAGTGPDFFLHDCEKREGYAQLWDFEVFMRAFRDCPYTNISTEEKVVAIEEERIRVFEELDRTQEEAEFGLLIFPAWRPADAA